MLAIKNAFRFIQWQWKRFETVPKLAVASMFSTLMSIVTMKYDVVSNAFLMTSFALAFAMFAVLVYTITKDQYGKFKEERNSIFNTIKHSEKDTNYTGGGKNII